MRPQSASESCPVYRSIPVKSVFKAKNVILRKRKFAYHYGLGCERLRDLTPPTPYLTRQSPNQSEGALFRCPVALTSDATRHTNDSIPHFKSPACEGFSIEKNIRFVETCACLTNGLELRCARHLMYPRLPTLRRRRVDLGRYGLALSSQSQTRTYPAELL